VFDVALSRGLEEKDFLSSITIEEIGRETTTVESRLIAGHPSGVAGRSRVLVQEEEEGEKEKVAFFSETSCIPMPLSPGNN